MTKYQDESTDCLIHTEDVCGEFPTFEKDSKKLTAVNPLKTGVNLNKYSLNSSLCLPESTSLYHYYYQTANAV